jgi:hypothetical protein
MKNFIVIALLLITSSSFAQQGKTIYKARLLDVTTREKVLTVDRGTMLDIIKDVEKGFFTVGYEGNSYLIFQDDIEVFKAPKSLDANFPVIDQETLNQSILFTNYCLNRFRVQQLTGIGLSIAGGIIAASGASLENPEVMLIGGAVSLGGFVVSINSYKWLRRAYVFPTNKGVAVGINF